MITSSPEEPKQTEADHIEADHVDFKGRTARGAFASIVGQVSNFALRIGSMMILARLLSPRDFGLVGMATAVTGFLIIFQDAGLSTAAIQSPSISRAQASALFWINLSVGAGLAFFCMVTAPLLARFYHEPRVNQLTMVIATGFLFNGAAAQHRAMLARKMRIALLATSDFCATVLSVSLGISLAALGAGYWALAAMILCPSVVNLFTSWMFGRWLPGLPRRETGVIKMIRYGSILMVDSIVIYISYNTDKILLGRFWGAQSLGFYGRAYQLMNIPTQNLSTAVNAVALPALSRLQHDPERLRRYFLQCYTLFLSLNMPITVACGLFGEDIIRVFLGPKWADAVPIFRLLAPTMLAMALINLPGLLLAAVGRVVQSLGLSLLIAPVVVLGYAFGLPYGPVGVAGGFSIAMLLLIVPVILWGVRGTPVSPADIWQAIRPPLYSIIVASAAAVLAAIPASYLSHAFFRLCFENTVLFGAYAAMLVFVMGQKPLYLNVLQASA
jgi:O-antigen/teichoic acid export membrane protein